MADERLAKGDQIRVRAAGTFDRHTGTIQRITQHRPDSQVFYWIIFDDHPWQKDATVWSFSRHELELLMREEPMP